MHERAVSTVNMDMVLRGRVYHPPLLFILAVGYMAIFIVRPFEVWPRLGDLYFERIYMVIVLLVLFLGRVAGKISFSGGINLAVLSFLGSMTISLAASPYFDVGLIQWWEYVKLLVFYCVLLVVLKNAEDLQTIMVAFVCIILLYESKSLWEYLVNGRHVYRMGIARLTGIDTTAGDPNTFSGTLVLAAPFVWMVYNVEKADPQGKWKVCLAWMVFAISTICIILTGSRSGLISWIAFWGLIWWGGRRQLRYLVVAVAVGALVWGVMPDSKKARFESLWDKSINVSANQSADGRLEGLKDGWSLFLSSPLVGHGPNSFSIARGEVGQLGGLQAHNLYGQVIGELGLLGTAALSFLIVAMVHASRKVIAQARWGEGKPALVGVSCAKACNQGILLLLLQGNFGHNLYRYNWLWMAAFLICARRIVKPHASRFVV